MDGESYNYKCTAYDSLGRPIRWEEEIGDVSYEHADIIYNEIGDIAYEKVFVEAESGGLFSSTEEVVTEYKYGYDQYGQYEKTWKNVNYREVSSNPLGIIVKAIIGITTTIFGRPLGAAAASFVTGILSGADPAQAFLSAVFVKLNFFIMKDGT